jgi:hypothetical protein
MEIQLLCLETKNYEPQKRQKKTKVKDNKLLLINLLFPFVSFVVQIKSSKYSSIFFDSNLTSYLQRRLH